MKIINPQLRREYSEPGNCEFCGLWRRVREGHHLYAVGSGGGGRLDIRINMIALGSSQSGAFMRCSCHGKIHNDLGELNPKALAIVAEREGTDPETIEAVIWFMQRLTKPTTNDLLAGLETLPVAVKKLAERELKEAGEL